MTGPGLKRVWYGALVVISLCASVSTGWCADPSFAPNTIHIYYDYSADGFLEINGIELDKKELAISIPNGNLNGKYTISMSLVAVKGRTVTSTSQETETIENKPGKIEKKTTRTESIIESTPPAANGTPIPKLIALPDIDYDRANDRFLITGPAFTSFQAQLQSITSDPQFRYSMRPAPNVLVSATIALGKKEVAKTADTLVLRFVQRNKPRSIVCCQKPATGLKWNPPLMVVNYKYDDQGLFTTPGPEMNPLQLTITYPNGLTIDGPELQLTLTTSTGDILGGDEKISVKNLNAKDGKIVIAGDDFKKMFDQMNSKFKVKFFKQTGPASDVIVSGTVLYENNTKALDVDGCLTIRMVLSSK